MEPLLETMPIVDLQSQAFMAAAVIAATQVAKNFGIPSKWAPLIALALGILLGVLQQPDTSGVLFGIYTSLMAMAGYSAPKEISSAFSKNNEQ